MLSLCVCVTYFFLLFRWVPFCSTLVVCPASVHSHRHQTMSRSVLILDAKIADLLCCTVEKGWCKFCTSFNNSVLSDERKANKQKKGRVNEASSAVQVLREWTAINFPLYSMIQWQTLLQRPFRKIIIHANHAIVIFIPLWPYRYCRRCIPLNNKHFNMPAAARIYLLRWRAGVLSGTMRCLMSVLLVSHTTRYPHNSASRFHIVFVLLKYNHWVPFYMVFQC